jgi:hypothetical protein
LPVKTPGNCGVKGRPTGAEIVFLLLISPGLLAQKNLIGITRGILVFLFRFVENFALVLMLMYLGSRNENTY